MVGTMTDLIGFGVDVLLAVAVWYFWSLSIGKFEGLETALRQPSEEVPDLAPVNERLDAYAAAINSHVDEFQAIRSALNDQTVAIAEGIERVDRSERRVRAAVARAKKRLDEAGYADEGVEAEIEGLRAVDGGLSEGQPMPAVHESVDAGQTDMSAFPGRW